MTELLNKAGEPFQNPSYLGYGAVGGYVGAYLWQRYYKMENIQLLGQAQIEAAIAGAAGTYIWSLVATPDTGTVWKGMLIGVAGMWIWAKIRVPMLSTVATI
jgi:hypothetical protein